MTFRFKVGLGRGKKEGAETRTTLQWLLVVFSSLFPLRFSLPFVGPLALEVGLENVQWPSKQAFLERKGRIDVYRYIHYTHICTKD